MNHDLIINMFKCRFCAHLVNETQCYGSLLPPHVKLVYVIVIPENYTFNSKKGPWEQDCKTKGLVGKTVMFRNAESRGKKEGSER